jgi:hypothetical protein
MPIRTMQQTVTPMHFYIMEGAKSTFSIPCFYYEPPKPDRAHRHNRLLHDHLGWPNPGHPDTICQHWHWADACCGKGHTSPCHRHCRDYLDLNVMIPLRFKAEGGSVNGVRLGGLDGWNANGLTVTASIDTECDWIIRLAVSAQTVDTDGKRRDARVAIFMNTVHQSQTYIQPLTTALITVLPALPGVE